MYIEQLKQLYEDMQIRFNNILNLYIPNWMIDSLKVLFNLSTLR